MITIPLAPVVAFLRRHDALAALEGAPYLWTGAGLQTVLQALPATGVETFTGKPLRVLGDDAVAALYLGTGDICPAAEGWAARVLALALDDAATHIDFSALSVAELLRGSRLLARWVWHDYPPRTRSFREIPLLGSPPSTPAARLAAVLHYELGRAA